VWRPRSWQQVEALIGSAQESASLDFKADLPAVGKNGELAKDIAAMAVNGGVLLYGVEEDPETGVAARLPCVRLAGAEERIRQVAGSRISPSPHLEIERLTEHEAGAHGILVVAIPPSPIAPHQVDGRFPTRFGTTTGYLTEPELERLYRQRHEHADRSTRAAAVLKRYRPVRDGFRDPGYGSLRICVTPLVDTEHPETPWLEASLTEAVRAAVRRQSNRMANISLADAFNAIAGWEPSGATGWQSLPSGSARPSRAGDRTIRGTYRYPGALLFDMDFGLVVQHTGSESGYQSAGEGRIALESVAALAVAGEFFSATPATQLIAAIWLEGFGNSVSQIATRDSVTILPSDLPRAPDRFELAVPTTPLELRDQPEEAARTLLDRWLAAFYSDDRVLWSIVMA
jgi:hypothetical protein